MEVHTHIQPVRPELNKLLLADLICCYYVNDRRIPQSIPVISTIQVSFYLVEQAARTASGLLMPESRRLVSLLDIGRKCSIG